MIKARGVAHDGTPLVILGITAENYTRMLADEPMLIHLAEMDLPDIHVVLVAGRDERAIAWQMEDEGLLPPGSAAGMPDPEPGTVVSLDLEE